MILTRTLAGFEIYLYYEFSRKITKIVIDALQKNQDDKKA